MKPYHVRPNNILVYRATAEELLASFVARKLDSEALVWREGLEEWVPVWKLAEELNFPAELPPLPEPEKPRSNAKAMPLPPIIQPPAPPPAPAREKRPESADIHMVLFAVGAITILWFLTGYAYSSSTDFGRTLTMNQEFTRTIGIVIGVALIICGAILTPRRSK